MGTLKMIHALMYWLKLVPVKEKGRERQKKRDSDIERADDCPKRHANCGPSSPVSIPTLGESLAHFYVAQIAQIKGIYYLLFGRHLAKCLAAEGGYIKIKEGMTAWRTFYIICAGRKSLLFWRNVGFYGLCTFKWPGLYTHILKPEDCIS